MEQGMLGGAGVAVCEVCCTASWARCSVCLVCVECPLCVQCSMWRLHMFLCLPRGCIALCRYTIVLYYRIRRHNADRLHMYGLKCSWEQHWLLSVAAYAKVHWCGCTVASFLPCVAAHV